MTVAPAGLARAKFILTKTLNAPAPKLRGGRDRGNVLFARRPAGPPTSAARSG